MKVLFIIPKEDGRHHAEQIGSDSRLFPPVSLTPMNKIIGNYNSRFLIDERKTIGRHHEDANIVIVFTNAYNQQNADLLAEKYHRRGSYVIFTGPNLSHDTANICSKADTLFFGPGEKCLIDFMADYNSGTARHIYAHKTEVTAVTGFGSMELSLAS